MKAKKVISLLLVAAMLVMAFAGCSNNDNNGNNEEPGGVDTPAEPTGTTGPDGREYADEQVIYGLYSSEVTTMNYLVSGTTWELEVGANTIDSLVENDPYGNIIPCAAESWETSDDGLVWTFHLREGQYWYDADGNQKDPVTANDYVAAARYVCDSANECGNSYLMDGWIVNATEALRYTADQLSAVPKGSETEDDTVVIDDAGVISELTTDEAGNETWEEVPAVTPDQIGVVAVDDYTLEYHLVKPRPYFLTVLQFGTYWPAPASLLEELGTNYGIDNYSMWFNGAYLLSTFSPQDKHIFTKNANNWDAEHIYIERIELTYNTESANLSPELFLRGEVTSTSIGADILQDWLADPERSQMVSTTRVTGDYSYFMGFNFEPKFDEEFEPENWIIAVNNENFRKAIWHGINRQEYVQAEYPGADITQNIINTVTPRGFAINPDTGKDFVMYGDLAKYTTTESFDEDLALQYKEAALPELTEAGCKFPIKMPINVPANSNNWMSATVVMEQQLENLLGADFIDVIPQTYAGTSFLNETRRNGNYAIQELNWGADYMDPETWTDPFGDENTYNFLNDQTANYGVNQNTKTEETLAIYDEYRDLVNKAKEEIDDMDARYEAFAAAEAFYLDHAIVLPMFISGGSYQATKLNGFESQYAVMGQASSRYKGMHVYKTAMSQAMWDEQYAKWQSVMNGEG